MQILRAEWVVPVSRPPLRHGRVAVEDGRIVWVGARGEAGEVQGPVENLGLGVLLPGLVNAHCHLELSHLAELGREPAHGFVAWVEQLVERRSRAQPEAVAEAVAAGIRQLVDTGTVGVGDVSNTLAHLDLLEAARLSSVVFYELMGWDPARAANILQGAERVSDLTHGARLRTRIALAAHAPYSVSAALLEGLVARGGPAFLHLAESADESRFLASGDGEWPGFLARRKLGGVAFTPPGTTPVRYMDRLGVLHPGLLAAHCVHVDDEDRRVLAKRGVHVVVCPRSNRTLGVGAVAVPALLAAGVRVCLGTDSLASVQSLDLLSDAAELHRTFPELEPAAIVRMATAAGAEALGFSDLGSLDPGKRAAMAFAASREPVEDPLAFLVSGEARAARVG